MNPESINWLLQREAQLQDAIDELFKEYSPCLVYQEIDKRKELQRIEVNSLFEKLMEECGTTEVQRCLNTLADQYGLR